MVMKWSNKTQCNSLGGFVRCPLPHIHVLYILKTLCQLDDITSPVCSSDWQQWALRQDVTTLGTSAQTKFSLNYTSVKTGNNSGEFSLLVASCFLRTLSLPGHPHLVLSPLQVQHSFIVQTLFLARYVQRTRRKTQGPLVPRHSWLELVHYVPQSQNVDRILLNIHLGCFEDLKPFSINSNIYFTQNIQQPEYMAAIWWTPLSKCVLQYRACIHS